jgi:hypothetical protein
MESIKINEMKYSKGATQREIVDASINLKKLKGGKKEARKNKGRED